MEVRGWEAAEEAAGTAEGAAKRAGAMERRVKREREKRKW
jgi:hypothetical protein